MSESTVPVNVDATSYYRSLGGGRYESTPHAQGAWDPNEQHMAPVTGIMTRELLGFKPRDDMRLVRLNFDILGQIPGGEFTLETTMLRPGRTIELLQCELHAGGRTAVRATAWRLQTSDTSAVAALEDDAMPPLDDSVPWDGLAGWPGGFIRSVEARTIEGHRPGNGQVWISTPLETVEGEATAPMVRLLGLADSSNGIAYRVRPGAGGYMFPNVDLSLHLYREPEGTWLGLDNTVTFADDGVGLTSTVLNDIHGPFGRAEQILTVRALP
ncbi:thioesterase family protein [Arthrobacter sp. 35W]|uniref:thioesterase family protein n=1 Tax=Arthrobacter sp. 35W TaxID=1132441 RepID=UPI000686F5FA|nr:thioesterase family protein [Arthrobacter sp. 35W]